MCHLQRPKRKNGALSATKTRLVCVQLCGLARSVGASLEPLSPQRSKDHAAIGKRSSSSELCGCTAAPCLQSSTTQGKSRGHRRLQPGNGDERRPRRRPLRPVRPERGREARRAGAARRGAGGVERAVPQGERERLRVHERLWRRHVRGPCPSEGVPSTHDDDVGSHASARVCGTEHAIDAGRCRSSTSSTSRSRWTPRRSAPAGSAERRA